MSTFWLKIVASDHIFYNGNCETLVVPAHDGEMGILCLLYTSPSPRD